ncbi:MAG TPA: LuxR C-terminal-related transcriptional regulator, partial [Candidatus Elarobacter sp.]
PLHVTALAVHRRCTGDADAAWYHSGELERVARAGGDAARLRRASTIRFALAAERGDDGEMERLDPAQEPARIATVLAGALRHGWSGDFRAAGIALAKLDESPSASDGERALCGALLAVAGLALGDASGVRRFARRTTRVPVLAGGTTSADEQRRMRLARDLAAAVRAGTLLDAVPQSDRGYARFVRAAFECRDVRAVSATLSPTELRVLALVEAGKNAPQIAALLDRSAHTIRTHLRNIGTKLETHSRAESVARARRLGLLPP